MPAEQQLEAVSKKLVELNPGFDGKWNGNPRIENGVVTGLSFATDFVEDISPVRALPGLTLLGCSSVTPRNENRLSDLSPLRGLRLESLFLTRSNVTDLAPLQGMPLNRLACNQTQVSELSPLYDCNGLKSLTITLCPKVTAASVAALQKALLNCKIEWDDPAKVTTPASAPAGTK